MYNKWQSIKIWVMSSPMRAIVVQFLFAPIFYVIIMLILDPNGFFTVPWELLRRFVLFNIPASLGFGLYVWYKNKVSQA